MIPRNCKSKHHSEAEGTLTTTTTVTKAPTIDDSSQKIRQHHYAKDSQQLSGPSSVNYEPIRVEN